MDRKEQEPSPESGHAVLEEVQRTKYVIPLEVARLELSLASPSLEQRERKKVQGWLEVLGKGKKEIRLALRGVERLRQQIEQRRQFFCDVAEEKYPNDWQARPDWDENFSYYAIYRDGVLKSAVAYDGILCNDPETHQQVREMIERNLAESRPPDVTDEQYEAIIGHVADDIIADYQTSH